MMMATTQRSKTQTPGEQEAAARLERALQALGPDVRLQMREVVRACVYLTLEAAYGPRPTPAEAVERMIPVRYTLTEAGEKAIACDCYNHMIVVQDGPGEFDAHQEPCDRCCGPFCRDHGDPRDTSVGYFGVPDAGPGFGQAPADFNWGRREKVTEALERAGEPRTGLDALLSAIDEYDA